MGKRHEAIGIKQPLRMEWLDKTSNLLLAGITPKSVRQELHEFLADRTASSPGKERGVSSRNQVVNMLMKIWVSPDDEAMGFRDASLACLQENPTLALPIHWGMISAAYPFWFNVARQVGRLLSLQDQVTQMQVFGRMKEQYGDRETVTRYTRCVIRSFVAWGVLVDAESKGCYTKSAPTTIAEGRVVALIYESALLATPEAKMPLGLLVNNPALFAFALPSMTGDSICRYSERLGVDRYGLDDELLRLKSG